jgi:quercetin dioxygenase-like cupin family protein
MKRIIILTLTSISMMQMSVHAQKTGASPFPKGKKTTATFTGTVWVHPLVAKDSIFNLVVGSVAFEPGARSFWHTHQAGQILLITDGVGYTQEKGKPIQVIRKGEVITCMPNVEHWHGASPTNAMTHISLNPNADRGVVTWLQPVTDAQYNGPNE